MFNSLWPLGLQHTRLPCPSSSPRACSNSCPSSWWCHPAISSSVAPFSSCPQVFPSIRAFSSESILCIRWPKYWSFSISPSSESSGLTSFNSAVSLSVYARRGTSLVIQQLRFWAPNTGGLGSIPGWGTRSHIKQLTVWMVQLKIHVPQQRAKSPRASTRTWHSQINKLKKKKKKKNQETVSQKQIG